MPRSFSPLAAAISAALLLTSGVVAQPVGGGHPHPAGRPPAYARPPARPAAMRGAGRAPGPPARGAWDPERHNGFWQAGRWTYGPPPRGYGPGEVQPGHSPWRRGGYLPPYYRASVVDDFARYRLRRPPYGYRWVYAGGDYMMVSASTGLIFDVIPGR